MVFKTKIYPGVIEALGSSEAFLAFQEDLAQVARVERPVLIMGERGSGKELAAVRLHFHSLRWQEPLIPVNCSALALTLLESELFGHEQGAFTGALRLRRGRLEAAHGGTLFLDEIGAMPMSMQEKLLRVLEYQVFERVGGSQAISVDARVVAATNADLQAMADQGTFKPDLLDRLAFEVLHVPALRERKGDVVLLAKHFATRMAVELGFSEPPRFTPAVIHALEHHSWPGNIRELKNVVERSVFRSRGADSISEVVFDPFVRPAARTIPARGSTGNHRQHNDQGVLAEVSSASPNTLQEAVANMERSALEKALKQARFNQRKAAEILGLRYHQFRGLYRKYMGNAENEEQNREETS